jgi:tetratricopeptide (TPR) repeat protein
VNDLTIGLLSALLATNQPQAVSNLIQQNTGTSVTIVNPDDPSEKQLLQIMADDDASLAEVDKWIKDNDTFATQGAGLSKEQLNTKINSRFAPVKKEYEDFLKLHPDSARGHLAYGTFLNDIGDEEDAMLQYENARELNPKNPAVWNNLANYYGENGPLTNAFIYYAKAIDLNSNEPVYYQNFATTVYMFRKDAEEFYGINEQQVFDKALALYRQAMKLAPDDFVLATDYAQNYYGIKPLRTNDALLAWTNALQIARDDNEREGVYIHIARIEVAAGRFADAQAQLDAVTNTAFFELRNRIQRNLAERENPPANQTPAIVSTNVPDAANNFAPAPTNIVATTNTAGVSTDLMTAPPHSRGQ